MSARAVALLLLGLTWARPAAPTCDDVITPLRRDQLDKVLGSWVLVGSMSDEVSGLLANVSSSFLDLSLSADNSSFIYQERNNVSNNCVWIYTVGNVTEDSNLTVQLNSVVTEIKGVVTTTHGFYGRISMFQHPSSPEDQLTCFYSGNSNPSIHNATAINFTLNYRRVVALQDPEILKQVPLETRRQAECLQMAGVSSQFTYDGVSEPCPFKLLSVEAEERPHV